MIISINGNVTTVRGNGDTQEIYDYLKPSFPGIRIREGVIVCASSFALTNALAESPFYGKEGGDKRQSYI